MRRKKIGLFYKIFFSIAVIGILLISGMGFYLYKSSYDSVYQNLLKDKERYINQISNNMDQKIQNIEFAFNAYSSTPSFETTFQNPITVTDFQKYQKVRSELNYLAIMGTENSFYSLISLKHKWMIRGDRLLFLTQEETDQYKQLYTNQSRNKNLYWEPIEDGLRMIMTLPGFKADKYALGIAEIPLNTIKKILTIEKDNRVAILDQSERVLFSSYSFDKTIINHLSDTSGKYNTSNGKLIYVKSDYNNWIYSIELQQSEVHQSMKKTGIAIIIVHIVLLLMAVVFAYVVAEYFTRPIARIHQKLSLANEGILSNDLNLIDHQIDDILEQNQSLSHLITQQKPELEKLFTYALLRGELSEEEIANKLFQLSIIDSEKTYHLVTLQFDHSEKIKERDLMLLAMLNILKEVIPKKNYFVPIIQDEKTMVMIVRTGKHLTHTDSQKQVSSLIEKLQSHIRTFLNIQISAGISSQYISLTKTATMYDEALEALRYRIKLGEEAIIFYNEISSLFNKRKVAAYPHELEMKLIDEIKLGYPDEATQSLKAIVMEIINRNDLPLDYEIAALRLVDSLISLAQNMYIDLPKHQGSRHLFKSILETSSPEQLFHILQKQLVDPIVQSVAKNDSERLKSISDSMVEIIQKEYDQEISLDSLAERLHYNFNYLSKVFKKEFGVNFSDYLIHYRLKKSKELLINSDYTVKEIAEMLQYKNSQNFIRFFKKIVDITPGEYRKKMKAK